MVRFGVPQRALVTFAALYLVAAAVLAIFLIEFAGHPRTFGSFWASGDAWLRGANPYAAMPATWRVEIPGPDVVDVNLNPPVTLPLMALIASVPLVHGAAVWVALSTLLALGCCLLIGKVSGVWDIRLAWALSCSALVDTLLLAQIYVFLLFLGFAVWFDLSRGRRIVASVALGILVAFKPNFALVFPVLLFAGHFRLAIAAAATAGLLTLAAFLFVGPDVSLQWLAAVRSDDHWQFPTSVSVHSYFVRVGVPAIGLVAAVATVIASLIWGYRTKPDSTQAVLAGLITSMLAAPLSWFHYTLVLIPFVVSAQWNRPLIAGAAILWLPTAIVLPSIRGNLLLQSTLGGLYLAGLVLLAVGLLWPARSSSDPAGRSGRVSIA